MNSNVARSFVRSTLKVIVCGVGGCIAGVGVTPIIFFGALSADYVLMGELFCLVGLFIGICWTIKKKTRRNAFIAWTVGTVISAVVVGNVFNAAVVLWLIVASVFAAIVLLLKRAGIFR